MAGGNFPLNHPTMEKESSGETTQQETIVHQREVEKISENLREQISQAIKDMKALRAEGTLEASHAQYVMPISFMLPQDLDAELDEEETPKKRRRMATIKVIGKFDVSYAVPPICIQKDIDMDNSVLYDANGSRPNEDKKFSFIERLQNWTIRQRERSNGKMRDVYYYHNISEKTFRSMKEVVRFMIYEKHPNDKDKKPEEVGEGSTAATASNEASGNEEI